MMDLNSIREVYNLRDYLSLSLKANKENGVVISDKFRND